MRSNKVAFLVALTAFATLAGCAAAPRVTPVGDNVYRVSATGTRMDSQAQTNYRALSVADSYCGTMGKQVLFRQSQESGEHSYSPKREDLTFTCMSATDPGYMNAGLRRELIQARDPVLAQQSP